MFLLVIRNPLKNQLTFIDAYNQYSMRKDNFHVYVERFMLIQLRRKWFIKLRDILLPNYTFSLFMLLLVEYRFGTYMFQILHKWQKIKLLVKKVGKNIGMITSTFSLQHFGL